MVINTIVLRAVCTAVLLAALPTVGLTQDKSDLQFICSINPIIRVKELRNTETRRDAETSEVKMLSIGLVHIYQRLISSQQNNTKICTFSPSCSHFGVDAIKEFGLLKGVLLTSDRLQRCNGMERQCYLIDPVTGKLGDGVEIYRLYGKQMK